MVEECTYGVLGACYTHDLASNFCQKYVDFLKSNNSDFNSKIMDIKGELIILTHEINKVNFIGADKLIEDAIFRCIGNAEDLLEELKEANK